MEKCPKIGVGVIVTKDNKVLLGQRKGSHGNGYWCFPGGHLEFNEEVEACAKREVLEEAGIEIDKLKIGPYTNDFHLDEDKHYITLFVVSEYKSGDIQILEPDKMVKWDWFSWDNLPEPLFLPVKNLLKQGYNPFKCN